MESTSPSSLLLRQRVEAAVNATLQEVLALFKVANEASVTAEQEFARTHEELRLYKVQLENAQAEIRKAQELLDHLEEQKADAVGEAERAKSVARQLREEMVTMRAREEGRRAGMQEGFARARALVSPVTDDDEYEYTGKTPRMWRAKYRPSWRSPPPSPIPPPIHPPSPVPSPSYPDFVITPDGYIPSMTPDGIIQLPPPHEISRPTSPYSVDKMIKMISQGGSDPNSQSTALSQFKLLRPPRHRSTLKDRTNVLSAIPEEGERKSPTGYVGLQHVSPGRNDDKQFHHSSAANLDDVGFTIVPPSRPESTSTDAQDPDGPPMVTPPQAQDDAAASPPIYPRNAVIIAPRPFSPSHRTWDVVDAVGDAPYHLTYVVPRNASSQTSPEHIIAWQSHARAALMNDTGYNAYSDSDSDSSGSSPSSNHVPLSSMSPTHNASTTPPAEVTVVDPASPAPRPRSPATSSTCTSRQSIWLHGFVSIHSSGEQNPPINTLYVGNLPTSTSPGSVTLDSLEDCLRELFSKQTGYRKLSFRQKSNGPMCFVEFENVEYTTKALHDLYGNTLNGAVKGGIRLSYSKNPLGVSLPNNGTNRLSLQ